MLASVLVQDGTLRVGDVIVCGDGFGRVRALFNDKGKSIDQAGPSTPVEISGLDVVPSAGENFGVIDDISRARDVAETRRVRARDLAHADRQAVTLENLYSKMAEQKLKSLNLILKADVQGSLEALMKELEKLENEEVPIRVLLKAVGGISESDIVLADASQAIVIGFRVAPEDRAVTLADDKKIEIRRYDIIYQVTDDIKKAVEGMLIPEVKEVHLGRAVVRQVFKISKVGAVAGCFVTQGTIERSAKVRLIREGARSIKARSRPSNGSRTMSRKYRKTSSAASRSATLTMSRPTMSSKLTVSTSSGGRSKMPTHRGLRMAEAIREVVATSILFDVADPRVRRSRCSVSRSRATCARHRVCFDHGDRGPADAGIPRPRPCDGLPSSARGRAAANPFHTGLEFQTRREREEIGRVGACDRTGHCVGPKAGDKPGWSSCYSAGGGRSG